MTIEKREGYALLHDQIRQLRKDIDELNRLVESMQPYQPIYVPKDFDRETRPTGNSPLRDSTPEDSSPSGTL